MKQHSSVYDDQFREIYKEVEEKIPETLDEMSREMQSWKRLMDMQNKEISGLQERGRTDILRVTKVAGGNFKTHNDSINAIN